jgi:hypothetical protein
MSKGVVRRATAGLPREPIAAAQRRRDAWPLSGIAVNLVGGAEMAAFGLALASSADRD